MSPNTAIDDRIEIADLFIRLARLLDERRWADVGTVFADDVAVHSPRGGEVRGLDNVVGYPRRAEVEGEFTQHLTTDVLVDVDGDRAAASANSLVYFHREARAPHLTSGLRLTCAVVRTPAGRRIRDYRIKPAWTQESRPLPRVRVEHAGRRASGRRGDGAPSGWSGQGQDPGPSSVDQGRVRIRGPSSVTATVCSMWAARLPSTVYRVQPSGPTR
ncbi:nuclear transport factor 2 family protein [Embleya sp. NPDC001921]